MSANNYVTAQISNRSKQEDPERLNRIYLDFEDGGRWVSHDLVLADSIHSRDEPNGELRLPPIGTLVAVLAQS